MFKYRNFNNLGQSAKGQSQIIDYMVGQSVDADVNGCWREWNDALRNVATSAYAGVTPTEKVPKEAHKAVQKVLDAYYKQK